MKIQKKYFIFIFTSAFLTSFWHSITYSYDDSLSSTLITLLIFYGISWTMWEIGKILVKHFVNGMAIISNQKKRDENSIKDFVSLLFAGVTILIIINLVAKIL